jgi:uncharacterized protein
MARRMTRRLLGCAILLWLAPAAFAAAQPPELTAPVNDFADVIRPEAEAELDSLIRRLLAASGDVLVVATVKTFQPAPDIQSYATEMFENHGRGIGQKGRDNGLLLLLAVDDRQVWAEVGYDLEGIITDGFAGETSRQTMVPYFRKEDYSGGLVAGATRLAQRIAAGRNVTIDGMPVAEPPAAPLGPDFPFVFWIFAAIVVINVISSITSRLFGGRRRRGRRRWNSHVGPFGVGYGGWSGGGWRSGGFGGGGGGFGGGFGGFGGGRSGGGGGGASW